MSIRIGVNPLCWMNSDIPDLGKNISVEQCISEIAFLGYCGVELEDPMRAPLKKNPSLLSQRNLELIGGWHSSFLLENSFEEEFEKFKKHLELLKSYGSKLVIIADCSFSIHRLVEAPLSTKYKEGEVDWKTLCEGLDSFAIFAKKEGMTIAYHHHMGTIVQNEREIDRLLTGTKELGLLLDTGHLLYAGVEPIRIVDKYFSRITHCHMKNVRFSLLQKALEEDYSFPEAILEGVFTVPGDNSYEDEGGFDFYPIVRTLYEKGYDAYLVMEAEQDPLEADPLAHARLGYSYLRYLVDKASLSLDFPVRTIRKEKTLIY